MCLLNMQNPVSAIGAWHWVMNKAGASESLGELRVRSYDLYQLSRWAQLNFCGPCGVQKINSVYPFS